MIWLVFGIMAAGAALLLVWPLTRNRVSLGERADYDLQVYRDQLRELADDKVRGLISDTQETAARTEIERRILALEAAAESHSGDAGGLGAGGKKLIGALMLVGVPGLTAWVYLSIGNPSSPDVPLASRSDVLQPGEAPPGMDPNVDEAIRRLADRLEGEPENVAGWTLLARSYAAMGRFTDSIDAYRRALAAEPENNDLTVGLGEAMVYASGDGLVSPPALKLFESVVARDPGNPFAQYYIGLANAQAGNLQLAMDIWTGIAEAADEEATWLPELAVQIKSLADELGVEPPEIALIETAPTPPPLPPIEPVEATGQPGPSAEDMAAAAEMSEEDRDSMIRSMVDRLASRLEENPDDVAGWKRLANARRVLGDFEGSRDAYAEVVARAPDDIDAKVDYAGTLVVLAGSDGQIPDAAAEIYQDILAIAPEHSDALWVLGRVAKERGDNQEAIDLWSRLLTQFQPGTPDYVALDNELSELR